MLVDIESRRVETFRRTSDQDWLFHESLPEAGDCLFPALKMSIPFDEIFENVIPETSVDGDEQNLDSPLSHFMDTHFS